MIKTDDDILSEREKEYGDADESFSRIALMWTAYIGAEVTARDVALMMTLLKIHRSKTAKGFHLTDSFQDARNYITLCERLSNDK